MRVIESSEPFARSGVRSVSEETEPEPLDIRRRSALGESKGVIAKIYGVANGAIRFIVNRINWKHV